MTQIKENVQSNAELNALFVRLDDNGQDIALAILRALEFAQTVMYSQNTEQQSSCLPSNL